MSRSGRVFVRSAPGIAAIVRKARDRFAWVDGYGSEPGEGLPRYSPEFLARGTNRPKSAAWLFALSDDAPSAQAVRECALAERNVLYLSDASYPRLLYALALGDVGRLRAMLFSSYAHGEAPIDSMKSLDDLVGSGLACIAPVVTLARPRAVVAANPAVLERAHRDLSGAWNGNVLLAPREARALYTAIVETVNYVD